MMQICPPFRHRRLKQILMLAAGIIIFPAGLVLAQSPEVITLVLQPHCVQEDLNDDWVFGNIPDVSNIVTVGEGRCRDFEVENPLTLRTPLMSAGDILDIDVVIKNPSQEKIQRVRVWLSYDPNILEGTLVEAGEGFPEITPGEESFDDENGFVMIEGSAEEDEEPDGERIVVANVKFTVNETTPAGTIISFYDMQQDGHTFVLKKHNANPEGMHALSTDPGSLHVIFGSEEGDICESNSDCPEGSCIQGTCTTDGQLSAGEPCVIDSQCESDLCANGVCVSDETQNLPDGSPCSSDKNCKSDNCDDGICASGEGNVPQNTKLNGSTCTQDSECLSDFCLENICRADGDIPEGGVCSVDEECETLNCTKGACSTSDGQESEEDPPQSTAFSLLQVQNPGVTTQGDSAYLGWDPLKSSRLKAYNVYYGTTTGKYIQRKTVEGSMQSLVIRSLPAGTTYYFAIRAVSTDDEESAFSNEVAVTIGEPSSSTSPLSADITGLEPAPVNPMQGGVSVPGKTGMPSILVLLLLASAVIGTTFASRRQLTAGVQRTSS